MSTRINTQRGIIPIIIIIILAALAVGGGVVAVKKNAEKKAERARLEADINATSTASMGTSTATTSAKTIHITLGQQNNSGQSGKVVITDVNGKAKVVLTLTGKPSSVPQPAHIHLGSCAAIGAVKYPLTNVDKGASQTTLDVSVADLLNSLPLSINVHKSATEANVYVACGNISASSTSELMKSKNDDKAMSGKKVNASSTTSVTASTTGSTSVKVKVNGSVKVQ